jgi:MraZ protein
MKGATMIELDAAGRMSIPSVLLEYIQINSKENDLVITGLGEKMEIWKSDAYQNQVLGDDMDFSDLAEEVRKDLDGKM